MKPNPNSRLARTVPQFLLTHKTPVTVLRASEGAWVKGKWVPGTVQTVIVEANVQPLKGSELTALPESDRTKESIKVYSVETLKTLEEVSQEEADIVVWEGKKFRAIKAMTYKMGVLDHTKTICVRFPETPQNQATYPSP